MEHSNNARESNSLQKNEYASDAIFISSPSISFRADLNWVPEFFEGPTEEITGYKETEFLAGAPRWIDIVHSEDRFLLEEKNKSILSIPGQVSDREYRIVHRDGTIRWVKEIVQNVSDRLGRPTYIMGAIYDITERKASEERKDHLRELELYTSIIGHDLSNDLQIILSYIESIIIQTDTTDNENHSMLQTVKAAVDRMSYLIRIFKAPDGPIEKRILPFLRNVAEQAEREYDGLKVHIHAEEGTESLEMNGSKLLPVVFANLFRNTVQHVSPEAEVNVHLTKADGTVMITVSDNGPGIPEKIREHLFQKGVSTKGGGLGLYLVQQILSALGGSIVLCKKQEGKGATFRITLPLDS